MDRRRRNKPCYKFDIRTMTLSWAIEDEDGNETEISVPAEFEVCGTCDGKGKHVNPSIDSNGISPEEFAEDPDFEEAYFSGVYDMICNECDGQRVCPTLSSLATKEQQDAWSKMMGDFQESESERCYQERMGF